jgi:pimeloyl-ACP methyl ester carboxylesterase
VTTALPKTRYARSGDCHIAYQVIGNGSIDLVLVPGLISNLDLQWEDAGFSRLMRRLSAFARVIQFDKRGTGLSDRIDAQYLPGLTERADDIRAVMDAAGSGRAVLFGASEGAALSIAFASAEPSRVRGLILYGGYPHFQSGVMGSEALDEFMRNMQDGWARAPACRFWFQAAPRTSDSRHGGRASSACRQARPRRSR